jgi:CheY-like chemotaxis protein
MTQPTLAAPARKGREDLRAPRILVVEDEAPLALLLKYNLESEGYAVEHAARGDEAEVRIAEGGLDLVVLDWMLPGVSGLEICRRMRAPRMYRTGGRAASNACSVRRRIIPRSATITTRPMWNRSRSFAIIG